MRALLALSSLGAVLVAAACDPYSPNLGDRPFRCGTDEPRCPEDYVCVDDLCEKKGSPAIPDGGQLADGRPFQCGADDSIEPNDTINQPTITPIPDFGDDYELIGLQVCPATDVDIFRFRIDVTGKNATVTITYPSNRGLLSLELLNSGGSVIRAGAATSNPDVIEATVANLASGTYFAKVAAGAAGVENDYDIYLVTTGP